MEQSCLVCRRPGFAEERARWGCDHALDQPWDQVDCWRCRDEPRRWQQFCDVCDGERSLGLYRCPHAMVDDWIHTMMRNAQLMERGLNPLGAPIDDWPAKVVDAVWLLLAEKARIEKQVMERAARGR